MELKYNRNNAGELCWNQKDVALYYRKNILNKEAIVGDIRKKTKNPSEDILVVEKQRFEVEQAKKKLGFFEKILGYIPCIDEAGQESWVRIVVPATNKLVALSSFLVVLLGFIGGGFWYLNRDQGPKLDDQAIAYQMPNGIKNKDPEQVLLPGYDTITLDSKTGKSKAILPNIDGNQIYAEFHIILKDDQKEIYKSGLVAPGKALVGFKTTKKLERGVYPVIVQVVAYDLKDPDSKVNGGSIETNLKVY